MKSYRFENKRLEIRVNSELASKIVFFHLFFYFFDYFVGQSCFKLQIGLFVKAKGFTAHS